MDVESGREAVSRSEWLWVARWVLLLTAAANLPYFLGYLLTPEGHRFLFLSTVNPADFHTYFAWAEQARQGHLFFRNLYTPEADARVVFHPLFYLIGRASDILGLSVSTVFHAARVTSGAGLLLYLYRLGAFLFKDVGQRRLFFWFATVATGLGGYLVLFRVVGTEHFLHDRVPADIHIPEAFALWSAALSPLFSLSILMMLALGRSWLSFLARGFTRSFWLGYLILILLPFVHPYDFFIVVPLIFIHAFFEALRRKILRPLLGVAVLMSALLPYACYLLFVFSQAPTLREWVESDRSSPPFYLYLAGIFFLLLPALASAGSRKLGSARFSFFLLWSLLAPLLAYLPFPFQRRLVEGWQIPLAVLAAVGTIRAGRIFPFLSLDSGGLRRPHRLYLIFSAFSLISVWATDLRVYAQRTFPYHVPTPYWNAFAQIASKLPESEGVLSSFSVGNFVPAYTGRFVYVGHLDQSLNRSDRQRRLIWFFSLRPTCRERASFMRGRGLGVLFFSPYERELGPFNPSDCPQFETMFSQGEVSLLRLRGARRPGAERGD